MTALATVLSHPENLWREKAETNGVAKYHIFNLRILTFILVFVQILLNYLGYNLYLTNSMLRRFFNLRNLELPNATSSGRVLDEPLLPSRKRCKSGKTDYYWGESLFKVHIAIFVSARLSDVTGQVLELVCNQIDLHVNCLTWSLHCRQYEKIIVVARKSRLKLVRSVSTWSLLRCYIMVV